MNKKLDQQLYKLYPKIFKQKDLSMRQTCMCWGICCGDGWYALLDTLCALIQNHINYTKCPQLEAIQVKEKFGTLRFYTIGGDSITQAYIQYAEAMSGQTCESCGTTTEVEQTKGWISTLCKPCLAKHKKDQVMREKKFKAILKKKKQNGNTAHKLS